MKVAAKNVTWPLRLLALVTLAALSVASARAAVPVTYPPPLLTEVTINNSAGDQSDPHVSGDWAAYTSDTSIRYYRFSTGVDAAIPMGSSIRDTLSDISGSRIVFARTIIGVKTAIMVFDAATAAAPIEIDAVAGSTRLGSAIGGGTVAYVDFGLHANGEIVIHDLATSTSVRITSDTAFDGNPSVSPSGGVVTWEHCATSMANCDIWQAVKTGGTWTVSAVTTTLTPGATWIWAPGITAATAPAELAEFFFIKSITLSATPTAANILVAADDFAEVRVNGTVVGTTGSTTVQSAAAAAANSLKSFNILPHLTASANTITIRGQNGTGGFSSCTNCTYQQHPAGILVSGSITGGGTVTFVSDTSWQAFASDPAAGATALGSAQNVCLTASVPANCPSGATLYGHSADSWRAGTAPEGNPDTNGTLIVYDSQRAGNSDIFWRPVAGGPEMQLQLSGFERNPSIAGDFIAFESQNTALSATDLFVYDVVNNRLFQITDTPLVNEQLNDIALLPDGRLRTVWASDEDDFDQRNVRAATFELPNVAPTLSFSAEAGYGTDGVSPDSGSMISLFTYKVVYTDFEGVAPSFIYVCIDGPYCYQITVDTAAEASLQDGDYKNGEQYSDTRQPSSPGVHAYFFEASDGTDTTRLPVSGTLAGPSVSDLRITTGGLPDATVGVPYSVTVTATGGTPPYTWQMSAFPISPFTPNFPFNITTATISGTATAAGDYAVDASVTDEVGDSVFTRFILTVNAAPSTPPVLNVPGTLTVNATSPAGAVVTYVVTATDAVDPNPVVACAPASGATFPIGTTVVGCTATNAFGSQSTASFNVVVKGAPGQITDLVDLVMSFNLKQGIENSLDAKLQNVLDALNAAGGGNTATACNKLNAFISEVMAQSGKAISTDQAAELIAAANQVKATLGCP